MKNLLKDLQTFIEEYNEGEFERLHIDRVCVHCDRLELDDCRIDFYNGNFTKYCGGVDADAFTDLWATYGNMVIAFRSGIYGGFTKEETE